MGWWLRINNFSIMGAHRKIFKGGGGGGGGGSQKKQYRESDCQEKRGLNKQFADLRGGLAKKEGMVFLRWGGGGGGGGRAVDNPMHTMSDLITITKAMVF